jgi:hypothetical protein
MSTVEELERMTVEELERMNLSLRTSLREEQDSHLRRSRDSLRDALNERNAALYKIVQLEARIKLMESALVDSGDGIDHEGYATDPEYVQLQDSHRDRDRLIDDVAKILFATCITCREVTTQDDIKEIWVRARQFVAAREGGKSEVQSPV